MYFLTHNLYIHLTERLQTTWFREILHVCILYPIKEVSKVIGVGLSRQLGWKTDLKNPQLEVKLFTVLKIFLVVLICCYNK